MLARVTVFGTYGGQAHINVLHFFKDLPSVAQFNLLGQKVDDFWADTIRGGVDGNMQWHRIHVEDRSNTYPPYDYMSTRVGALSPSTQYCQFISACFLFHTLTGGRQGRGRSFQGGYGHGSFFNSGAWVTSTFNRIFDASLALSTYWCDPTDTNTIGWKLAVASRAATVTDEAHPVTAITGRPWVSTMNSRKVGRGA